MSLTSCADIVFDLCSEYYSVHCQQRKQKEPVIWKSLMIGGEDTNCWRCDFISTKQSQLGHNIRSCFINVLMFPSIWKQWGHVALIMNERPYVIVRIVNELQ